MKFITAASAALLFAFGSSAVEAKPLDRPSVLQLTQLGLGDDAIVAKI
ncbi:MAG TPA: hypothetical protein VMQ93_16095 [Novosphingobium sp.]|nr:hypothetical protein [Novosphingobium sp.]